MEYVIKHQPSYASLHLRLGSGEHIKAEAGAMVTMTNGLEVETKMGSGFLSAIKRKLFGGESFFFNYYRATCPADLVLAPDMPGDILPLRLQGQTILVQASSYLASVDSVHVQSRFGGLKTLFGGEGLFLLEVSGTGEVFLNSYGAIIPIEVNSRYTIDTGHIVAFDSSLQFEVKRAGGSWKSTFLSGEGLVADFSGRGRVWIQTRVSTGFVNWLTPLLPQ